MLFTVTSTASPWDFYFFKLTQPLTVQLGYTVKKQGRKPDRKPLPLSYSFRNPYSNLKSENSPDYAQKPQQNCTFMNLASGINLTNTCLCFFSAIYYSNVTGCPFYSKWSEKLRKNQGSERNPTLLWRQVGIDGAAIATHNPLLVSC